MAKKQEHEMGRESIFSRQLDVTLRTSMSFFVEIRSRFFGFGQAEGREGVYKNSTFSLAQDSTSVKGGCSKALVQAAGLSLCRYHRATLPAFGYRDKSETLQSVRQRHFVSAATSAILTFYYTMSRMSKSLIMASAKKAAENLK